MYCDIIYYYISYFMIFMLILFEQTQYTHAGY